MKMRTREKYILPRYRPSHEILVVGGCLWNEFLLVLASIGQATKYIERGKENKLLHYISYFVPWYRA